MQVALDRLVERIEPALLEPVSAGRTRGRPGRRTRDTWRAHGAGTYDYRCDSNEDGAWTLVSRRAVPATRPRLSFEPVVTRMNGAAHVDDPHASARGDAPEGFWGARAAEYDEFIVRVVPRYAEMVTRLLEYLPATAERVLELGSGTGNVSAALAARWPNARFTFVDAAPEMLDITRARLQTDAAEVAAQARFQAARFEELQLEPQSIDVAVASLSLHHVQEVGDVYARLAPALAPRGRLVMLDAVRGETEAEQAVHMARWQAYWRAPGNLSDDEIRDVAEHVARHDFYRSLSEHFAMLRSAGFASADCIWRDGLLTLLTAAV